MCPCGVPGVRQLNYLDATDQGVCDEGDYRGPQIATRANTSMGLLTVPACLSNRAPHAPTSLPTPGGTVGYVSVHRNTSPTRKRTLLGTYRRAMPRVLTGVLGGGTFSYGRGTPIVGRRRGPGRDC